MKSDYDVKYYKSLKGKEALEQRLNGKLPIIEICDHIFFVDMRISRLFPQDFKSGAIILSDLPIDEQDKSLSFYYHPAKHSRITLTPDHEDFPKDAVLVKIPNMYYLDPIGMARQNGKEDLYYYKGHHIPLKMYHKAGIFTQEQIQSLVSTKHKAKNFMVESNRETKNKKAGKRKRR